MVLMHQGWDEAKVALIRALSSIPNLNSLKDKCPKKKCECRRAHIPYFIRIEGK
jgi:hypothetical protein